MDNIKISTYTDLQLQIDILKKEKKEKEDELKYQLAEITIEANPIKIIKEYVGTLLEDKGLNQSVSKIGINLGANFLIEKILGRNRSIKGYLSSMLVEKFSTSIINTLITKHQTNTTKKNKNEHV